MEPSSADVVLPWKCVVKVEAKGVGQQGLTPAAVFVATLDLVLVADMQECCSESSLWLKLWLQ